MSKKSRFVLIDANSIIHRAYHAYPHTLTTSSGEQVNAVYGFSVILLKLIKDLEPVFLICAFDVAKPTFRHKKYPAYKATRKPMDKELALQFPRIKEIVRAFDIPIIEVEGFEADDVIGTLDNDEKARDLEKVIVTGDQDIFQLVDSDTKVYLSGRNFKDSKLFDKKDVEDKVGLKPSQIVDYKALFGDPSDNIPGVKGVGKKGAVKLIQKFKNLKNLYENIDKVDKRYRKKLEESRKQAYLSYDLAKIVKDVPLKYSLDNCKWGEFDMYKIKKKLQDFEFRSLLKRLEGLWEEESTLLTGEIENKNKSKVVIVEDKKQLSCFIKQLKKQKHFAFKLITKDDDDLTCSLPLDVMFSWGEADSYCMKWGLLKKNKSFSRGGKQVKDVLENKKILKIGYDIKSSIHALRNCGINLNGIYFDIKIAAYLIQGGKGGLDLADLAFNYIGEVIDRQLFLHDSLNSSLYSSEGKEIQIIWRLYKIFKKKFGVKVKNRKTLCKRNGWNLGRLFSEIEMPLVNVLAKMERNGILIDKVYLRSFTRRLEQKTCKAERKVFECIGHEFNIASPKQVSEVLFEELALPKPKKTKSGNLPTGSSVLENLKDAHPVIKYILKYRELAKLRSTYTTTLLGSVSKKTGKIHTTFNQTKAATGRLSSSDPNLQNIPITSSLGRKIRTAFVSQSNSCLVSFDISQQELRILAHLTKERDLIRAFEKGLDVHALTAAKIFNKNSEDISKKERRIGKTINFGVMYGMSAYGLVSALKISLNDASEFIKKYFEQYKEIKKYFDKYIRKVRIKGFAETLFGRRRSVVGLDSANEFIQRAAVRELINFPIQGTAADMMKLAMIQIDKLIQSKFSSKAKMILQIHDELIFEFKGKEGIKEFKSSVKDLMEGVYPLNVPLKVDVYVGKNLGEVH